MISLIVFVLLSICLYLNLICYSPASFAEMRVCESCNTTITYELHYRITIQNNGKKDIEQVSVLFDNKYAINEETKSKYCNLISGSRQSFEVLVLEGQKEVKITVTGKNTIPLIKPIIL